MLTISAGFDAGNIDVISAERADDIQLAIRADNQSDFLQWFYYRVQGCETHDLTMRLVNADQAAYEDGWPGYEAVASYDRQYWFRVPTRYEEGELVIEHTPEQNSIYYAYFAPYSYERHLDLLGWASQSPLCRNHLLGLTLDGRDLDLLHISATDAPTCKIWIMARQHPGETMAEWLVEGLLERLLDDQDSLSLQLLEQAEFYIVPNMNPDGSVRGHLRTNAAGVNLNREWQTPALEHSPEVYYVREAMQQTGVDLLLDIHGDEALPCNFIAGQDGVPTVSDEVLQAEHQFRADLMAVNPDFQIERGYAPDQFGEETMTIASNWIGDHFGCPAMTLEMPFKDFDLKPDPAQGWSPERSIKLGQSLLYPVARWLHNRNLTPDSE
ncbi:MAG: M14-type cytosolic carboxypeptidase [Amphritea sp.]|nr:M14-type cytosolic carboxypeptidase [Amphritea sp.]